MSLQSADSAVATLLRMLDVQPSGEDTFLGQSPDASWRRLYGGQVLGQGLMAASKTVDQAYGPHSLHGTFLRPGDPSVSVSFQVERTRDGQAFVRRRLAALQHGRAIFEATVSFHRREDAAFSHQSAMPQVPDPEALEVHGNAQEGFFKVAPAAIRRYWDSQRPLDLRPVSLARYTSDQPQPPEQHMWLRARSQLPAPWHDSDRMQAALLAYASDMTLLDTALLPHGRSVFSDDIQAASLDHAIWFHRPVRADDWLLYTQDTPVTAGGRGFTRGTFHTRGGDLVASTAQEGLIRKAAAVRVPAGRA